MQKLRRFILVVFLAGVILSVSSSFVFALQPELQYPQVQGAEPPTTSKQLPQFIKYLFNLSLIIAGLIAFGALVYGGIMYVTSAGNPGALGEARTQIFAALIGIAVLFGSYILLTTINPQLIVLQISKTGAAKQGVILYSQAGCPQLKNLTEDVNYLQVKSSRSLLPETFTKMLDENNNPTAQDKPVKSIRFFNSGNELDVFLYKQQGYKEQAWDSKADVPAGVIDTVPSAGTCVAVADVPVKSVNLVWKTPGVYVFSEPDCKGQTRLFVGNTASFGEFDDKAKSLMIIPSTRSTFVPAVSQENSNLLAALVPPPSPDAPGHSPDVVPASEVQDKFGAVLFENERFRDRATVFLGGNDPANPKPQCVNLGNYGDSCGDNKSEPYCVKKVGGSASSIKVFRQRIEGGDPGGEGVIVWGNYDSNWQKPGIGVSADEQIHCGPINAVNSSDTLGVGKLLWVTEKSDNFNGPPNDVRNESGEPGAESKENCKRLLVNKWASSISIDGNYMAVLFREDGRGEVFTESDIRLTDNHIGDNQVKYILVIPLQVK